MTTQILPPHVFEDFQVGHNQLSVSDLFQRYETIGFLYPAKKRLLSPYFDTIQGHWETLLDGTEDLLWILTREDVIKDHFASISVWKNSNRGVLAQHLVSSGNPFLSLYVMLAAQYKFAHHYDSTEVNSSQNWFRPNNRYAYRVFASMFKKLGASRASLMRFQYLHQDLASLSSKQNPSFLVEELVHPDASFIQFVSRHYNSVFVQAEELDQPDLSLNKLGKRFQILGMERSRKILTFKDPNSHKLLACVIANRAPMGLNFSFLENRAYYLTDPRLEYGTRDRLLLAMSQAIEPFYEDFPLGVLPIVTDAYCSHLLQKQGACLIREYMQSIWMRDGFELWYQHIWSFLERIERRQVVGR